MSGQLSDKAERPQNFFENTAGGIDHTAKNLVDFRMRLNRIIDSMVGTEPEKEDRPDKGPQEVPGAGTRLVTMAQESCNRMTGELESAICRLESCGLT